MVMINTLYLPEIREMLADSDTEGLRDFTRALHPARTAEFMEGLTATESWVVLRTAQPYLRAQIFGYFDEDRQIEIVEKCNRQEVSELITDMPADDCVDLLEEVHPTVVEEILPLLPVDDRRDILRLREYPDGTAGAVMTTEVARLPESMTVREALLEIGRQSQELETIYYIYIVDGENHLRGLVSARQLVANLGKGDTCVRDLMERDLVTVYGHDDQEVVADKVANFDFLAIPVVDDEQHLLGIITHDDIIDVLLEEAEEDAYLAGAINPLQESYLETPWYTLAWKRGLWLFILSMAALLTVIALRGYENVLKEVTWLALFIPLIISCGGNSGGQSATLVITSLTTGDLKLSEWRQVLWRELIMGLSLGTILAALGYVFALLLVADATTIQKLVVPITLLLVVVTGTVCGGALPLIFRRLGLDPALMSNPFVAGIIDVAGILIYMAIAVLMLDELQGMYEK